MNILFSFRDEFEKLVKMEKYYDWIKVFKRDEFCDWFFVLGESFGKWYRLSVILLYFSIMEKDVGEVFVKRRCLDVLEGKEKWFKLSFFDDRFLKVFVLCEMVFVLGFVMGFCMSFKIWDDDDRKFIFKFKKVEEYVRREFGKFNFFDNSIYVKFEDLDVEMLDVDVFVKEFF